jgi:hypothetical protein
MNISIVIPGLSLHAPDPLAYSLGSSETAGLQLAAELARQGHGVVIHGVLTGVLDLSPTGLLP